MREPIPKIIHFVYHPDKISAVERSFVEKARALHPDWTIMEWAEPYRPEDFSLSHLWSHCKRGAQLADLIRVDVVAKHGGLYLDVDFEVLAPLDSLLPFDFVVGTEDGRVLTNAFFGSVAAGGAIEALRLELSRLEPEDFTARIDLVTGPVFFARTLAFRPDVTVLPREVVYPYNFNEPAPARFRTRTLAVHRWHGSWVAEKPPKSWAVRAQEQAKDAYWKVRNKLTNKAKSVARTLAANPMREFAAYPASGPLVIRTVHGHYLHADAGDLSVTPTLAAEGFYELPEEKFLIKWLKGGDWLADVGANIGVMSVLGAAQVGPMGRVLAFEPNPVTRGNLEKSIVLNWFHDRVRVMPQALGRDAGRRALTFSPSFLGGGSLAADRHCHELDVINGLGPQETLEVEVATLDALLPEPFCLRLLKIDVEGFEAAVLQGARELLQAGRVDAILLEVSPANAGDHWPELHAELRALIEAGFSSYRVDLDGTVQPSPLLSTTFDQRRKRLFVHASAPWPPGFNPNPETAHG